MVKRNITLALSATFVVFCAKIAFAAELTPISDVVSDTQDAAAKAALAIALPLSRTNEFGGVILQKDGKFYFTVPYTIHDTAHFQITARFTSDYKFVAIYHTHPGYNSESRVFSGDDVDVATRLHKISYIGLVQDNTVRVFVPGVTRTGHAYGQTISEGTLVR
jgi:hypothetical protein